MHVFEVSFASPSCGLWAEYRLAQVREGSVVNTHPQLAVKGTAFDRTLGGLEMEFRLRDFLAGKFEVSGSGLAKMAAAV